MMILRLVGDSRKTRSYLAQNLTQRLLQLGLERRNRTGASDWSDREVCCRGGRGNPPAATRVAQLLAAMKKLAEAAVLPNIAEIQIKAPVTSGASAGSLAAASKLRLQQTLPYRKGRLV